MSLDVYLIGEEKEVECVCECGHKHSRTEREHLYEANITHNLNKMAEAAGIYKHLWRPEELGIRTAKELIEPLTKGLERLRANPEYYMTFNPENKWGNYEVLVKFVEDYIANCESHPEATVKVCG